MVRFDELVLGGVFVAPFMTYAIAAAVLMAILVPLLRVTHIGSAFSNPPLVLLCLYVVIVATLVVLVG